MGKFVKVMDYLSDKLENNPIERFLTNLVDRIHAKLNFYRTVYILIGLGIILGTVYYVSRHTVQDSNEFWILFFIGTIIGTLFITISRFAKDKPEDETLK